MESKLRFNRCCNPLRIENHSISDGLRPAPSKFQEQWNLTRSHYLCVTCRKKLGALKSVASTSTNDESDHDSDIDGDIPVAENLEIDEICDDTNSEKTEPVSISNSLNSGEEVTHSLSQLSLGTQLPVINESLFLLNVTPLDKYEIDEPSYLIKKYKEICSAFSTLLGLGSESNHYENSVDYQNILKNLKAKFDAESTTRGQRLQILTLLPGDWSINKICDVMGASKYMAVLSKSLKEKKGIFSEPEGKKGRPLSNEMICKVIEFYENDDVSVNLPGKKDFLSVRKDNGQKEHIQKKLILCNLKELYEIFKKHYPDDRVGFSSFASLRPVHCVLAGSSGTHTICVCAIHQNIKLMILGSKLAALTHSSTNPLMQYSDCLKLILYPNPTSNCYLLKCVECPGINVLRKLLETLFEENEVDDIKYKYWISNPRCSLETIIKSTSEFVDTFCDHIKNLLPHEFIAKEQSTFMKVTKESLQENEFLVICDFAENYALVIQNAAPGFHWNNNQATIFPVVIYYKQNSELTHRSLVIISDGNNHDAIAVHVYLKIVTDFIKESFSNVAKIFYFSDGAPQQFKNFKNFVNIYYHREDFEIDAEWHYFATAHGKGPFDGIGGTVKKNAARASLQRPIDEQITTARELYESQANTLPNIIVKFSPENNYLEVKEKLGLRFNSAKSITGTQKLHLVVPVGNGNISVK